MTKDKNVSKICINCKRETNKTRRGMCQPCYRLVTGFSGGDPRIYQLKQEVKNILSRLSIVQTKISQIEKEIKI